MRITLGLLVAMVLVVTAGLYAAEPAGPTSRPDEFHVYLVTVGPGDAIYEKFDHNAIWIHDPSEDIKHRDVAFNYGLFNFGDGIWDTIRFLEQFVRGDTHYWMGGQYAKAIPGIIDEGMLEMYKSDHRDLYVQELNLTAAQGRELSDFLWDNAKPENRYYRYQPYDDNCSTRVRDALDKVLQGQIRRQTETLLTGHTYRWQSRRITQTDPLIYTALEFILGHWVDQPISAWQEMFLPASMQVSLRQVKVLDDAGNLAPLVKNEYVYNRGNRPAVPVAPPEWTLRYLILGLGMAAVIGAAWLGRHRNGVDVCSMECSYPGRS